MSEAQILLEILKVVGVRGLMIFVMVPYSLILVMWFLDTRRVSQILADYKNDMAEIQGMYKNNVELVKSYNALAKDLHDVVIMNTTAMTSALDAIKTNQFCPLNRIETRKVQGGSL